MAGEPLLMHGDVSGCPPFFPPTFSSERPTSRSLEGGGTPKLPTMGIRRLEETKQANKPFGGSGMEGFDLLRYFSGTLKYSSRPKRYLSQLRASAGRAKP